MPIDYSGLSPTELITELELRDAEIIALNQTITDKSTEIETLNLTVAQKTTEITTLNQTIGDKDVIIAEKVTEIQTLNQALTEKETEIVELDSTITTMKTPDGLLETVNAMEISDKKNLAQKVRTTNEGIAAYFAVNHGAEAPSEALIEEEV